MTSPDFPSLAELDAQERELVWSSFGFDEAWRVG